MSVHYANSDFWTAYGQLPAAEQKRADRNFARLKSNPQHPSLKFKPVGRYWSVRVGINYRALAVPVSDGFVWFWIGTHAEYDQIVGRLQKAKAMMLIPTTEYVHEGRYVAEVDVTLIETESDWAPYYSLDDAEKLEAVRFALKQGDLKAAARLAISRRTSGALF